MTLVVGALMIAALAVAIAYPFWRLPDASSAVDRRDTRESLNREKSVALLAIREAELDRAMGKLSDEDYGSLRNQYERRAVTAITALDQIDRFPPTATPTDGVGGTSAARFCSSCGRAFKVDERFCPACGRARSALS